MAVVPGQKKANLCQGLHTAVMFSTGAQCVWGHCIMLFSLTLPSCMSPCKVWWEDILSQCGLSQPHKSLLRLYSFFFLPIFSPFFYPGVIFLQPQRAARPAWPKCDFYRKHVTNVQQDHFLCRFLPWRNTSGTSQALWDIHFYVPLNISSMSMLLPMYQRLLWIMLIMCSFTF